MKLEFVDRLEAARYMGIKGAPDVQCAALLEKAERLVCNKVLPKYTYRLADISFAERGVLIGDIPVPFVGNDIKNHLKGCARAVVFAATLTSEADKLIRRAQLESTAFALAMDCICSAAIEQVCNNAESEIFSHIKAAYRTWRFSPGYGDLPLNMQQSVIGYLDAARRIGLTVTEQCLLLPSKSVTAIIGISDKPVEKSKKGCESCKRRMSCAFSASGNFCGNE